MRNLLAFVAVWAVVWAVMRALIRRATNAPTPPRLEQTLAEHLHKEAKRYPLSHLHDVFDPEDQ